MTDTDATHTIGGVAHNHLHAEQPDCGERIIGACITRPVATVEVSHQHDVDACAIYQMGWDDSAVDTPKEPTPERRRHHAWYSDRINGVDVQTCGCCGIDRAALEAERD